MRSRWMRALPLAAAALLLAGPARAEDEAEPSNTAADAAVNEIANAKNAMARAIEPWLAEHAPWLLTDILGSGLWRFFAALFTVALFAVLASVVMRLSVVALQKLTKRTATAIDDELIEAINPPLGYLVVVTGVYLGLFWPNFPAALDGVIDVAYRLATILIVGWTALRCTGILTRVLAQLASHTESELDDYIIPLVGRTLRVMVYALIVVFCLQELGYNVAGLLAGLGVGGLAFALAAQDTVSNWFGALMIYTDRPFVVGDWVKTPSIEGVVEEIGLRSTKIRTFSKTLVSVPNNKIATDAVENFSRMPRRRISFKLGVTYSTTPDMMRALLEDMKRILREHPAIDQTFWLVKFSEFADSSLNIMVYCFTVTTDWDEYLSIREELNLTFMDAMGRVGVQAAFPSRSIYMEDPDPESLRDLDRKAKRLLAATASTTDVHESKTAPSEDAAGGDEG